MKLRLTPSFVVAVLALVVATGGVGYAAGRIGSAQIKDNSVQSKDVRNNTLTSKDVRNKSLTGQDLREGSLGRSTTYTRCGPGELFIFGACVLPAPYGPSDYDMATFICSGLGGRLPTIAELRYIADQPGFTWADGNPAQYEFTSTWTTAAPIHPMAFDQQAFNSYGDASAQAFHFHCLKLR
ncbi:hypothetical protein [Nocardioides lijunqiniae]|uniref:hypothetical protein n=1 Tax=Nocardioides lijunqiniae TaxID=2760832 RepID=UPI0018777C26|nr:hypothetical protein [Nocardioides lijunqiniae]